MNTLPVKWVPPLMLLQNKITKTPMSGRPIETIPVVRVSDLDALREGLEEIHRVSTNPMYTAMASRLAAQQEAQRLLALLPPKEGTCNGK